MVSGVKKKAELFCKLYNGTITDTVPGKRVLKNGKFSTMAYIVTVEDRIFHIYFSRQWYYKYDGITIPLDKLIEATEQDACIVIYVGDNEFWRHSTLWLEWAEQDKMILKNTMYDKVEAFIKRRNLALPPVRTGRKLEEYFP